MKKKALLSILLLNFACTDKTPEAKCADAGSFVMTLKNEPGRIIPDSSTRKYYVHFSPDGKLQYNIRAYPCNLPFDFQAELNVYFDADFYQSKTDTASNLIMYIRDIDYR